MLRSVSIRTHFFRFLSVFPALFLAFALSACSDETGDTATTEDPAVQADDSATSETDETTPEAMTVAVEGDADRGAVVAVLADCSGCHTPGPDKEVGTPMYGAGGMLIPGVVAKNITQDVETGIGSWSDEEIEAALRDGLRPDGTKLYPVMPYSFIRMMSDQDMKDLIAFLRTVPPVHNPLEDTVGNADFSAESLVDFPLPDPTGDALIDRGAYISTLNHCMLCHTPNDADGKKDYANQLGAGGVVFHGPDGAAVSANITPHESDGIAGYSAEDIVQIFRTGKRPDGTDLFFLMGTRGLHDLPEEDLEALAAYVTSLSPQPSPVVDDTGE